MVLYLHHLLCSFCVNSELLQWFSFVSNQRTRRCLWWYVSCKAKDELKGCRWRHFNFHRLPYPLIKLNYPLLLLRLSGKIYTWFPGFLPDLYVCLCVYLHVYVMRLPYARISFSIGHGLASLLMLNLSIVDCKLPCEPWARVRMVLIAPLHPQPPVPVQLITEKPGEKMDFKTFTMNQNTSQSDVKPRPHVAIHSRFRVRGGSSFQEFLWLFGGKLESFGFSWLITSLYFDLTSGLE